MRLGRGVGPGPLLVAEAKEDLGRAAFPLLQKGGGDARKFGCR